MSIAITAPEKFEFQDLVCVDLALRALESGPVSMIPEHAGHEDATLSWPADAGGPAATVEVQVKGASGVVDMAEVAEHLLHYPDRTATGSLLERLMDTANHAALFVMSARCTDILEPLLADHASRQLINGRAVPAALVTALREAVKAISEKPLAENATNLRRNRQTDAKALAARPPADYERAVSRLTIIERETTETVEVRLHRALQRRRFDILSIRGVLASLTDHLSTAKRNQTDVVPAMLQELEKRAPQAVKPATYMERGLEAGLVQQLEKAKALLFAGPPRAGKSWIARRIGGELQHLGFEVRIGSHIDEAERFLTDPTVVDRLYILDDPLGSREPASDASARLAALRGLIDRLPTNRRLIVAQTDSVLLQTRGAGSLAACALGAQSWFVITPLTAERAVAVWRAAANDQGIGQAAIDRVAELIERDEQLRDPGALAYLAQTFDGLPDNADDAAILFQARSDAIDFARGLAAASTGCRAMLSAAALATEPGQAAAVCELAFIANGGEARPGLAPKHSLIKVGAGRRPAPAYDSPPALAESQHLAVEDLQRRRVLGSDEHGLNFTHPYLRAGAQALLRPDIPGDLSRVVEQAQRSLACVDASTSLAAARNLRWLRAAVEPDARTTIYEAACTGIRSLFPATRDACFAFLMDMAVELSADQRHRMPDWAEYVSLGLGDIDVSNGIGFVTDLPDIFATASPLTEIQPYLSALDAGEPLGLDLPLSRRILLTLRRNPDKMSAAACRRFLRADEAVVRAAAARAWLARPREGDEDIIEWLAHDRAPSISKAILDGVAGSWADLNATRRAALTSALRDHATSPGCASVLLKRLVLFNRVEYYGETPPWSLFADVMPAVIRHLPLSVSFQNGRLNAALEDAFEAIPPETLGPLVQAWATRLQDRLAYSTLDEYELAIVGPLIAALPPDHRLPLLRDLLGFDNTGARVVTVKWLLAYWDKLSPAEHMLVSEALAERRSDKRWIAATVLTRSIPQAALVEQITGGTQSLSGTAEAVESLLGPEIFAACIRMFRGAPQPLWWFGVHHSDNPDWPRLVKELAANPDHPLFAECFVEVAASGLKGELLALIDALPESALMRAFELLLQYKLGCTGFWRDKSWRRLLTRAEDAGLLDAMFERIDEVSDGILEHLRDVYHWLGDGHHGDRLLNTYPRDAEIILTLRQMEKASDRVLRTEGDAATDPANVAEVMRIFVTKIVDQLDARPCRLFSTWDILGDALRKNGGDEELALRIQLGRTVAVERHLALREGARDVTDSIDLDGWVHQMANAAG